MFLSQKHVRQREHTGEVFRQSAILLDLLRNSDPLSRSQGSRSINQEPSTPFSCVEYT